VTADASGVAAPGDQPWYVAHTKPRQEELALANLSRQGYSAYLPRLKVLKTLRSGRGFAFQPLFPRYLFLQPAHTQHSLAPVRSTKGVTSLVRFGGLLAVLRPETVERIRTFERAQHVADANELDGLQPGKTVVITAGPLAGLQGLVALVARERVTVLMRLLGEDTRVTVNRAELKLAA
jgi:transcriptional antiterminator RfaH